MGIIFAIIIFSFIVFFHELGHFLLAKKNGIDVEEFAIGMGPVLVSKTYKDTKYCIKLLPLGGSCMMGEDEEASDSPSNFNNKPVLARISVIAAGPIFNFILAFVFSVIITFMVGYDEPVIGEVEPGYPAYEAGMQEGDMIYSMNGKRIHIYREISMYTRLHDSPEIEVVFSRNGEKKCVTLVPKLDEETKSYRIGILGLGYKKGPVLSTLRYSVYELRFWIVTTLESLKMLVTGRIGVNQLSGPVGIVNVVDQTYQVNKSYGIYVVVVQLLNIAILLSANLGVMNLIPFPALDGGRLIFLFVELIRGKRIPPEKEGYVHLVGIILLMLLMVFVMYNDIRRIFM